MRFTAAISREGSLYLARCRQLQAAGQGDSPAAALESLREALESYFDDRDEYLPEFDLTLEEPTDHGRRRMIVRRRH